MVMGLCKKYFESSFSGSWLVQHTYVTITSPADLFAPLPYGGGPFGPTRPPAGLVMVRYVHMYIGQAMNLRNCFQNSLCKDPITIDFQ